LAMHFLRRYAAENEKPIAGFDDDALRRLARYDWPGNVRELENAIERAVVVCRGDAIRAADLAPSIVVAESAQGQAAAGPAIPAASLAELEKYATLKTLEHTGGSTSRAAEMLGISTRKIQYKLHEYERGADGTDAPAKGSLD